MELGKLAYVDPRDVWTHEAYDFTPWLLDNAEALSDILGIDLELTSHEYPVGGFALDLIGRDLTNDCVLIVENQLAGTDHGHLGQILTYAAGTDAATIVWVATGIREEHRQALDWLNNLAGNRARFFGIELQVVRIGGSPVAPLLRLRAQPNDWHAQLSAVAKSSSQASEKGQLYREFWTRFLERVHEERPTWTKAKIPQISNWMTMPSPIKGAVTGVNFTSNLEMRTELYIDSGDGDTNDVIFQALLDHKEEIESQFGEPLVWEPLEKRRACRVAVYAFGDVTKKDAYDAYIDWFISVGTKFRAAVNPFAPAVAAALEDLAK